MTGVRRRQREQTRQALVDAASTAFAERGFAATSLASVVAAAQVTKGAMYHHFTSKEALFEEVVRSLQAQVAADVSAGADEAAGDGWAALTAGCRAFMTAATRLDRRRVLLVDGPAVLGLSRWRELDDEGPGRLLRQGLAELASAGLVPDRPVEPLARLLSGAMNEAALWACDGDLDTRLRQADAALCDLLESLQHSASRPSSGR